MQEVLGSSGCADMSESSIWKRGGPTVACCNYVCSRRRGPPASIHADSDQLGLDRTGRDQYIVIICIDHALINNLQNLANALFSSLSNQLLPFALSGAGRGFPTSPP